MQDLAEPHKETEQIKSHQTAMFGGEVALREYLLKRYKEESKKIPLGENLELPGTLYTPRDSSLPKIAVFTSLSKKICGAMPSCLAPDGETILFDKSRLNMSAFLSEDKKPQLISPEGQRAHVQGKVEFELKYIETEGDLFKAYSAQIKKTYNIQGDEKVLRILEQGLDRVQFMLAVLHYANGDQEKIDKYFPKDPALTTTDAGAIAAYDLEAKVAATSYAENFIARSVRSMDGSLTGLKLIQDFKNNKLPEGPARGFKALVKEKYVDVMGDLHLKVR